MTEQVYELMIADYHQTVQNWANKTGNEMNYEAVDIASKILMHRDDVLGFPPGHFVSAFLNNDLQGVMNRADSNTLQHLVQIYKAWYNIDTWHIARKYKLAAV